MRTVAATWLSIGAALIAAIALACTSGSATTLAPPTRQQLPLMVLPPEELAGVIQDPRIDPRSGWDDYPDAASRGIVAAYGISYADQGGIHLVQIGTEVWLYETVDASAADFDSFVEELVSACSDLQLRTEALTSLGHEAIATDALRQCYEPLGPLGVSFVVFRIDRLIARASIVRYDRAIPARDARELAKRLERRIIRVLEGEVSEPAVTILDPQTPQLCRPSPSRTDPASFGEWVELRTDTVATLAREGSTAHRDLAEAHEAVLATLAWVNETFGTSYGGPLEVYLYEDKRQPMQGNGQPLATLGLMIGTTVHEICGGSLDGQDWADMPLSPHEITHVVTLEEWGRPGDCSISEGIAYYSTLGVADRFAVEARTYPLAPFAPPTAAVPFDDATEDVVWATLVTMYLIEERGDVDQYRAFWERSGADGFVAALDATYGLTVSELDAAIRDAYELPGAPAP